MASTPARVTPGPGLLNRILDEPELVAAVQRLDAQVLGGIMARVGLEDAGELLALATTEQLKTVLDDDLWRGGTAGKQEAFDPQRFGLWLAVMAEVGPRFLVQKLTELDEDLLTLGLCHNVLVLDLDAILQDVSQGDDPEPVEQALESSLNLEFENYVVISRDPSTWDAVIEALTLLDTEHHHLLQTLLRRCQRVGEKHVEDHGGLLEVLSAQEELASDVAGEREERREQRGFVSAANASAFLGLARLATVESVLANPAPDPITRGYERSVASGRAPVVSTPVADAGVARLMKLLGPADATEPGPRPRHATLTDGKTADPTSTRPPSHPLMRAALTALRQQHPAQHGPCLAQLTYLANVLLAGCPFQDRVLRPLEAADAAMATCNLGLEEVLAREPPGTPPEDLLRRLGAVNLFMAGFGTLHRQLALPLAQAVLDALPARHPAQAAFRKAVAAGKPWTARPHLDALQGRWDAPVLTSLKALLDVCPWLPVPGAFISSGALLQEALALAPLISRS